MLGPSLQSPKGPKGTVLGDIRSQIILTIPNIETLHSTIEVHWTLWDLYGPLAALVKLAGLPRSLGLAAAPDPRYLRKSGNLFVRTVM